ncbi:MAG: hypothetical protein ACI9CP_002054 [Cryomorphaceae bacterium]
MSVVYAIQVLFGPGSIPRRSSTSFLNLEPQLSNEEGNYILNREDWVELSWEYTADGNEAYMNIGNFQSNTIVETLIAEPDSINPEDHFSSYYYIVGLNVGTEILSSRYQPFPFQFKLWPNPSQNRLSIETDRSNTTIEVFSIQGK